MDGPPFPAPYPPADKLQGFIQDVHLVWPREFHSLRRVSSKGFSMLFVLSLLRLNYKPVILGVRILCCCLEMLVYEVFGMLRRDGIQFVRLPQRALANGVFYLAFEYVTNQFVVPGLAVVGEMAPDWRLIGWLLQFTALYLEFAYQFAGYKAAGLLAVVVYAWLT